MKRATLLLVSLLAASMFAFIACDDEPTQQEANEQFCDDTAEFIASLRVVRDLDSDATLEEIEAARDRVKAAHDAMIGSSVGVVEAQLDDFEEAWAELETAVDDLEADATLEEALGQVDDEVENASTTASQVLNDVDCGGAGSGAGSYQ